MKNKPYYSDDNLEKYIGHLTGYSFLDKKYQIDTLKKLIHLDEISFEKLNASSLGEIMNDITNKDQDHLRRYCAVITKKPQKYTNKQKSMFKGKSELENTILKAIKSLK